MAQKIDHVMKLVRSPDDLGARQFEHSERRYSVVLMAQLFFSDLARPVLARVSNISAGGLMAIVPEGCATERNVSVVIRHIGTLSGQIVWARDAMIGVKFREAIDPVALLADRARSARMPAMLAQQFVDMNRSKLAARAAMASAAMSA